MLALSGLLRPDLPWSTWAADGAYPDWAWSSCIWEAASLLHGFSDNLGAVLEAVHLANRSGRGLEGVGLARPPSP